ncbi:ankyrin [Meredithblackwellia eburnea MCA 4105]
MSQVKQYPSSLPPEAAAYARQFFDYARRGDLDAFSAPLKAGLPPNLTNEKGDTLLMLAAYSGHAQLVTLLISHGADANRLNDKGQSPLAGAVFKGEDEVVRALLAGGADPLWGAPSPVDCLKMFKQEGKWEGAFESAPGRGKGQEGEVAGGSRLD